MIIPVKRQHVTRFLYVSLGLLYLLHNDVWFWSDSRLVFSLPVSLLYHLIFCLVCSLVLLALVYQAWPSEDTD